MKDTRVKPDLQRDELDYSDLFDHVPVGIFRINQKGKLVDVNPALIQLLGYPDRDTLLSTPLERLFNRAHTLQSLIYQVEQHNTLYKQLAELIRYDGSSLWAEINARAVPYKNGKLIDGAVLDITGRVQFEARLKRQLEEMVVLNVVAGIGAEATNEEDLLVQAVLQVGKSLYPNTFSVLILSPENGLLRGYLTEEKEGEVRVRAVETSLGKGIVGQTALDGQTRRVPDTRHWNGYVEVNPNTRSEMCVAMQSEGKILGVINLESPYVDGLSEDNLRLLTVISRQLATAISKVRSLNAECRRRHEAETLSKATASLVSSLDTQKVLHNILSHLAQVIPIDLALAILLEGNWLRAAAALGENRFKQFNKIALLSDEMPYAHILRTHKAQIYPNLGKQQVEDAFMGKLHEGSWMGVPLTIRGRIEGFLTLYNCQAGIYSKAELALVQAFANQTAAALENARLFEQTRRRAYEMESLIHFSSSLRSAETSREMYPILLNQIQSLMNADTVCLFLHEERKLRLVASTKSCGVELSCQHALSDKRDPFYMVVENRQSVEVSLEEVRTKYRHIEFLQKVAGDMDHLAIVPLMPTDLVNGVILIGFRDSQHTLSQGDWRLLLAVAEIAGNALRRASVMETLEQRVKERTHHLATLYEISGIASQSLDLHVILERSLDKILDGMVSWIGAVHLINEDQRILHLATQRGFAEEKRIAISQISMSSEAWKPQWIIDKPQPVAIADLPTDERAPTEFRRLGFSAFIGVPIAAKGRVFGLLSLFGESISPISAEDIGFIAAIADQIGNAIESARLRKQAEEIAVMEERQRLARELHDSVTQALYSITLLANAAQKQAANNNLDRAVQYVHELGQSAQQALKEMRLLIYELRPSALENEGLSEALFQRLESVERRAGIHTQFHLDPPLDLPPSVEEGLYRVTIEALNNVLKHSSASHVIVNLWAEQDHLILEIEDDGVGFDPENVVSHGGVGLISMRERLEKMGGKLTISSALGKGTMVQASVPLARK